MQENISENNSIKPLIKEIQELKKEIKKLEKEKEILNLKFIKLKNSLPKWQRIQYD